MFRRSAMLVLGLLSTAAVGVAVAQNPASKSKSSAPGMGGNAPPMGDAPAGDAPAMGNGPAPASQDTTHHAMKAAKPTWTKDQIKAAQVGLVKTGLYKGDTDGVMNAATRKALRAYQKQNKMPATGRLSEEVLAKLKAS